MRREYNLDEVFSALPTLKGTFNINDDSGEAWFSMEFLDYQAGIFTAQGRDESGTSGLLGRIVEYETPKDINLALVGGAGPAAYTGRKAIGEIGFLQVYGPEDQERTDRRLDGYTIDPRSAQTFLDRLTTELAYNWHGAIVKTEGGNLAIEGCWETKDPSDHVKGNWYLEIKQKEE